MVQNEVNNPRWKARNQAECKAMERINVEEIDRNVHRVTIINGH